MSKKNSTERLLSLDDSASPSRIRDLRVNDLKLLRFHFQRHFDSSAAQSLLQKYARSVEVFAQGAQLLGEGAHFQSWLVAGGQEALVLKIHHTRRGADARDDFALQKWQNAMAQLRRVD